MRLIGFVSAVITNFEYLMKSKNKKDTLSKFQKESVDEDFKNLMKRIGVEKLEPSPAVPPQPKKAKKPEPIEFVEDEKWTLKAQPASKKDKYSQTEKQFSTTVFKRKKKIVPGFVPDVEIDLHGSTRDEAILKTKNLLESCRTQKCQTALIITGRGLNSGKGEGVLRKAVWAWLATNSNRLRITCRWAPAFLGGNGAIVVFFG